MADQGNSGQAPSFASLSQPGMNPMTGGGGDALAPIFPPQNFDVPDISFSNSVSPNAAFNHSLFNPGQMFSATAQQQQQHYPEVPSPSGHAMSGLAVGQQQASYFPPPSNSPPGTSSSEDSDDLPLAQLAKRGLNAGAVAGSPSGQVIDSTSLESSPISGTKKTKAAKKKKKKDPNEPQKPVSAYALFFRDTQATIKGHNPNASFGEVSKIVASMWDQLDPEHKDVYKKKTETAKKQYLKQLAAYRASQVSQSAADESEGSSSPPSVMSHQSNGAMSQGMHPGGPVAQPATNIPASSQMMPQASQMMPHHMLPQQHFPQHQMVMAQQGSPSPPLQQQPSPMMQQGSPPAQAYSSPPHGTGPNSYQQPVMDNNMYGYADTGEMEMTYPSCVRSGCGNYAKESPSWDAEYCSNDCVISHCRDIFTKWVASRTDTNSYPVK
ncbi:TOX high mobility group box family member 4-A [Biomphalaria glabrata]|nr:TOX high mobility group box family member 4-A [Biomphalaria glabrata]